MVGFATVIAIGIVIGSISVSMIIFWESQTTSKFSEYGDEIKVGNVKFDVQYVTNYEFLEKDKAQQEFQELYIETGPNPGLLSQSSEIPEGVYFQIQITANNTAKKSGDFPNLSDEDISTIALSLQLKAELVTDDFALSNVAKNLSIKVIPVMTSGIKNVIIWKYYCPGCKTNFSKVSECPRCGNKLKRKPLKN